ncbi:MAG: dihydrodipicolinate synthase family protein, partial [Candidatus Ranarchaeia archaeon]
VNTPTTVRLAKHAQQTGADAIAAITPFYFHPDEEALVDHYTEIAEAVKIPFFLYNLPSFTTVTFPPRRLKDFKKYSHFAGIKDTSKNLVLFMEYLREMPDQGVVVMGADRLFVAALAVGSPGMVCSVASAIPDMFTPIYDAFLKNDLAEAQRLQLKVVDITKVLSRYPEIAPFKTILQWRGVPVRGMMPPLRELTETEEKRLKQELSSLDVIPEI